MKCEENATSESILPEAEGGGKWTRIKTELKTTQCELIFEFMILEGKKTTNHNLTFSTYLFYENCALNDSEKCTSVGW